VFDPVTPLSRYRGPRRTVITRLNDRPDAYHALVPGLPVTRVEGTGHWLQLDAPEEVNRILDGFLAEVG
jgi:pimeloyl-ACP methyl ester carboxylesterase